jgi:predicted dehydrogenase
VEIAGICNRGNSDLTPLARQFNIEAVFSDWQRMLDVVQPDAVVILVSHFQTVSVTAECLKRGLPCLIEKPAGFTSGETAYLADLAEENNCINMVAVNRRFYSTINAALNAVRLRGAVMGVMIEAPEKISQIRETSRHSPQLIDQWLVANTIHAIDLFRHIGGEVVEVHALTHAWSEPHADSFSTTLRFASGALGTFLAHWQSVPGWRLCIYGEGIQAILSPFEKGELRYADGSTRPLPIDPVDTRFKPGFYNQSQAFVQAIMYGEPLAAPASDLRDAVKTMQLIEQIGGLHVTS